MIKREKYILSTISDPPVEIHLSVSQDLEECEIMLKGEPIAYIQRDLPNILLTLARAADLANEELIEMRKEFEK